MHSRFILLVSLALGGGAASAATVQGLVTDAPAVQPIAGARVVVLRPGLFGGMEVGAATTGADGRYTIDLPGYDGPAVVVAAASGHAARNQNGEPCMAPRDCVDRSSRIMIADGVTTVDFDLPVAARLGGRVVEFDGGANVGFGTVTLEPIDAPPAGAMRAEIAVNADGTFRFKGLHAGRYKLAARTRRGASYSGTSSYLGYVWPDVHCDEVNVFCNLVQGDALTLAAGDDHAALSLRVRKGAYVRTRLFARNSNQPLDELAMLYPAADPATLVGGNDIGSTDGYAYVGPVFAGTYKLVIESGSAGYMSVAYPDAPCPRWACDPAAAQPIELADGQLFTANDAYANPARSIAGRVTEWFSNRPLAGVRVAVGEGFSTLPDANGQWGFGAALGAVTDADGRYLIEGIDVDRPIVRTFYSHAGFMDYAWPLLACRGANLYCNLDTGTYERVDLVAQPHRTGIDIELAFGNAIRGRVEYPDGSPAPNYFVAVIPFQANRVAPPVRSGADGTFRLEGLGPDRHYLVASRQPIGPNTHVTLRPLLPCYVGDMSEMLQCDLDEARITTLDPGEIVEGLQFVVPFEDDTIFRSGFEP